MPASRRRWWSSASSPQAGNVSRREMGREAFVAKVWEWKEQSGGTILEQSRRLGDCFDLSRNRFTMDEGFHDAVLQGLRRLLRARADLPRQAAGQLGPAFRDRDLRPRGRAGREQGPPLAAALPARGRRDLQASGRVRRRRQAVAGRSATISSSPPPGRRRCSATPASPSIPTTRATATSSARPCGCRWSAARSRSSPTPTPTRRRAPARSRSPRRTTSTTGRSASAAGCRRSTSWTRGRRSRSRTMPPSATGIDRGDELADLDGLDRYEARDLILTLAEEQGWLDGIDEEIHTVPHGDRSKVAIEPFLTDQWYVDAATLAKPALAGGPRRPHPHPARARREDLFPLAGEYRALVHLAPALVGAPDPGLVRAEAGSLDGLGDGEVVPPFRERRSSSARASPTSASRPRPTTARASRSASSPTRRRLASAPSIRARAASRGSSRSTATPTSSTPGSPPASGRSARSAGPRRRRSSRATTRPACSSPASTSSSSGSPG